jgi:hypothetical protein
MCGPVPVSAVRTGKNEILSDPSSCCAEAGLSLKPDSCLYGRSDWLGGNTAACGYNFIPLYSIVANTVLLDFIGNIARSFRFRQYCFAARAADAATVNGALKFIYTKLLTGPKTLRPRGGNFRLLYTECPARYLLSVNAPQARATRKTRARAVRPLFSLPEISGPFMTRLREQEYAPAPVCPADTLYSPKPLTPEISRKFFLKHKIFSRFIRLLR